MKYFILTLSILSFCISSLHFVKDFNLVELKEELAHTGLFQDANSAFTHLGSEKIVCYRQTHRNFYVLMMTLTVSSLGFIYYAFEQKKRLSKELIIKNEEVVQKSDIIEEKNKEIISGLNYAQRLQRAMLSDNKILAKRFPNSWILNRPKDIVSGDFYWMTEVDNFIFIAVADCTGHGVPGAFMTILGSSLINQIIIENNVLETDNILNDLCHKLYDTFYSENQNKKVNDGMDISLIRVCTTTNTIQFSGAKRNLLVVTENNIYKEMIGSKQMLSASKINSESYGCESMTVQGKTRLYLYSDGITDQLGGNYYKKFMSKNFKNLLANTFDYSMNNQRQKTKDSFLNWKGTNDQTDDVMVIGIEIS